MVPLGEVDGELPLAFAVYLPVLRHCPIPISIRPPVDEAAAAARRKNQAHKRRSDHCTLTVPDGLTTPDTPAAREATGYS